MENVELLVMTQQTMQNYANIMCQRSLSEDEALVYGQACEMMRNYLKYQDILLVRSIRDAGEPNYGKEIFD